ncbi:MAG: phenylalanine--tRNA ligase subunit alpha, partial [Euryarchaeota archaeon]|nr:phenylalanine--tRNA ligase subunit alpha [Euryarchaeota archaeon]
MELTPHEQRLLQALQKSPQAPLADLARDSGLHPDAAQQAAFMLQEKDLARVEERRETRHTLTPEGERYAREGLPERRALAHLQAPRAPADLEKQMGREAPIALGWLRRKNWAQVQQGQIQPGPTPPPPGDDETALQLLLQGPSTIPPGAAETLEKRGLAKREERAERTLHLTPRGRDTPAGTGADDALTDLTPQLLKTGGWRGKRFRAYDPALDAEPPEQGRKNPYARILDEIRAIFLSMGFTEIRGPIIQSAFWNFDALFQP